MHQSLSGFLRAATDAHFEGPIPAVERERIRIVENAERAFDRSLSPLERAVKSLSIAYADVLKDSALVEASRQLRGDAASEGDKRYSTLHRQRAEVLAESASWLCETARQVAERARGETQAAPGGN
ncbi:MAG TPA: hypothetical protein VGQ35_06785 [Dongiaceae bacterium]|jgi:hypothetical protein|nr:hypothetical protein [Dongiaceae bacterium]